MPNLAQLSNHSGYDTAVYYQPHYNLPPQNLAALGAQQFDADRIERRCCGWEASHLAPWQTSCLAPVLPKKPSRDQGLGL